MKYSRQMLACSVVALLALTGCSGANGGKSSSGSSTGNVQYVEGGTFTIAVPFDPGSLNPFTNYHSGNDFFPMHLAYESLVALDESGTVMPLIAEKWNASTTEASFTLREGITCSDGSALTATDVADNINYVANPDNKAVTAGAFVQLGSKATADDATRTVKITSGAPDPFLLADIGGLPIVCRKGIDDPSSLDATTIGTSLYKVTSQVAGNNWTLERRKDYSWGPGDWKQKDQKGLPDKIIVKVVSNTTTQANLLLNGDINFAVALDPADAGRLSNLFKVAQLLPTGVFLFNEAPGHVTQSEVVRRALIQGLDLEQLSAVIDKSGQKTKQIDEYFLPNVCPGETTEGIPTLDVDAANAALDSEGWLKGPDGIRTKGGEKLTLTEPVLSTFPAYVAAGELQQQMFKELGVQLKTKQLDGGAFGEALTKGDFDLVMQSWSFPTPSQMVSSYTGKTPSAGGGNIGDVHNLKYEALIKPAATKPGQEGCAEWNLAEKALIEAVDVVPFWSVPSIMYGNGAVFALSQFTWSIHMTKS